MRPWEAVAIIMAQKRILLIISGGIAAYKALHLIRLLRGAGYAITPVMTKSAEEFITPLSVAALAESPVHHALFDLDTEAKMGHIALSRSADLVLVAPATAHLMARLAHGLADDLATTLLLATDTPIMLAPAMNVRMWAHPATMRNHQQILEDGVQILAPDEGPMACGEYGAGRMVEPEAILSAVSAHFQKSQILKGRQILITSGPTHEPIDPVRYIANRSSGTQGTALANALLDKGATVRFITGPAEAPRPHGAHVIEVETARQMHDAVMANLPADVGIFAAAVADWRVAGDHAQKIKKEKGALPALHFAENPDILAAVSQHASLRPPLVIGFAAETEHVIPHATAKRARKGCDWILANDVSPHTGIMGGTENEVHLITQEGVEHWPSMSKTAVAERLAERIAEELGQVHA